MPDPTDPIDTVAKSPDQSASAANSADETAPHAGSASPKFGPPAAPGEVGTLGPYRLVKQLGAGGMGAVYLAIDTRLDRKLALKVMLPEFAADRNAKERFLREARAAAKISHDNVVTVFEADEREGVPYIAMQFLQGYPLDDYLKQKGAPALAHVIRIGREAAAGLAAAHALGLVHRDIKPANLWLEAPNGRVKVLDFGLAKPIGSDTELTKSGAVVGTPSYMSPEQARGQKVDHRTDIFSLGAVLYRLVTGQNPFTGPNVMAVLMALGTEEPTPVRELNPSVPESLAQLIHQLLAKKPEQRPQTATEVAKRLRAVLEQLLNPGAPASTSGSVPVVSPPEASSSHPVVVHALPQQPPLVAPMSVSAQPESVFANLTDEPEDEVTTREEEESDEAPAPAPEQTRGKFGLIAVGAAVVLALVAAAVIVIKIKNKDGTETEIKVPDGASVSIEKDGKSIVKVDPKSGVNPKAKTEPKIIAGKWESLSPADVTDWSKFWEAYGPQDWKLQDGELFNASGGNRGWLGTKAEYTDFEIELEYKFGAKGNSGIFLRAWPEGELNGGAFVEVQLVDDDGYKTTGLICTGAVFNRVAPSPRPVSKLNEWNKASVTVVGKRVTVTINGTKCVDADVEFPRAKGVIGLQQLDSPVYFRKVQVRDLTVVAAAADPDRAAAAWVLGLGGTVQVNGENRDIKAADLPKDPFTLTWVDLRDKQVTDSGLAHLKELKSLTSLDLDGAQVTDAGLTNLKELKNLTALGLGGTKATDAGLIHLKELKGLTRLWLFETKVTDAGLIHLKELKNLASLVLNTTPVTDAGLEHLKELKNLTTLHVSRTQVSSAGLVHLKELKELTDLGLSSTKVSGAGLTHLADLKNLEILWLDDTPVSDAGLEHLKELKRLTQLYVKKTKVTAKGLDALHAALPACRIEHDGGVIEPTGAADRAAAEWVLSVGGSVKVNDEGRDIRAAADLPKEPFTLTRVNLEAIQGQDAGLARLKGLQGLKVLNLSSTKVSDAGVEHLKGLQSLRELNLANTQVSAAGLAHLRGLKSLQHLRLDNTPLSDAGLVQLKELTGLTSLNLEAAQVTDAGLAPLKELKNLQRLWLHKTKVTDAGLEHLKELKELVLLNLEGTQVLGAGLAQLKELKNLQGLYLHNTKVSDATLEHVKGLQSLRGINLSNTPVTDAGLAHLKELKELMLLSLNGAPVTDAGLAHLKELRELVGLDLSGTQVSDAGLAHLKELANLRNLWLNDTTVTDAGLTHLKELKELTTLGLNGTKVTDAGLESLKGLKELATLGLQKTPVTAKGLEATHAALPACQITHDGEVIQPTVNADRAAIDWALSIGGRVMIQDAAGQREVAAVKDLPNGNFRLVLVFLRDNKQVTDAGLERLKGCTELTYLRLYNTPVTDAGLAHFKWHTRLARLDLTLTKVTDAGLANFKYCKGLVHLGLRSTGVTDAGLATFKGCILLNSLSLNSTRVTDAGLVNFKDCKELTRLNLGDTRVTDAGLANFIGCTDLGWLNLKNTNVTAEGVAKFAKVLPRCKIEWDGGVIEPTAKAAADREAAEWALSVHATALVLHDGAREIPAGTNKELPATPFTVVRIHLNSRAKADRVTDADMPRLGGLTALRALSLAFTDVTDAGLTHLKGLSALTQLGLDNTRTTDAGLESVGPLIGLTSLWLDNANVTDAGLEHLTKLTNLTALRLEGTKVTAVGVAKLQKALPKCSILWDEPKK